MRTVETKIYTYDELSNDAKEKAKEWYRNASSSDTFFAETIIEDAKEAGLNITSWNTNPIEAKGKFITDPRDIAKNILKNHGKDCKTYKISEVFVGLREQIADNYPKEGEENEYEKSKEFDNDIEELEHEYLTDLCHEYACMIDGEYEYQNSDEQVEVSIKANEYEFYENGEKV